MPDLPPITIVVTTYFPPGDVGERRQAAAVETVRTWEDHMKYDGDIRIHIADDGSGDLWFEQTIADVLMQRGAVAQTRQHRHGVGASLNAGFREAFKRSPLVLYAVDDWQLSAEFDLTPWAELLMRDREIGMMRLGPPHPDLTGTVRHVGGMIPHPYPKPWDSRGLWYLRLDRHHFAFAHRPALYHQRMIEAHGWFDEDVNAYDCERMYSERFNWADAMDTPHVALALAHPWFPVAEEPELELAHINPREG